MKRTVLLFTYGLILTSCAEKELKTKIFENNNELREKLGLIIIDKNWKLDSTLNFLPVSDNFLIVNKELKSTEEKDKFYILDFYSNNQNQRSKKVYYKQEQGTLEIVEEQDIYKKALTDFIDLQLTFNYNYRNNTKFFHLDSLPTSSRKKINQQEFNKVTEEAKKKNMEICGTSAVEILEHNFPKRCVILKEKDFLKIKKGF